ncbi:MAG: hypothetical protein ACI9BW_002717 [Gammaproteobacteria bacterium]|jgi:hypothetical protein
MSEPEILLVVNEYGDTSVSCFALYTSILFAYLTVAYLVGGKLSTFQSRIVSGLFIAAAGVAAIANVSGVHAWIAILGDHPTALDQVPFFVYRIWHYYMGGMLAAGVIVSLYFMYDVRRKQGSEANEGTST